MKAVVMREHGGPEVLALEEMEAPTPSSEEVLIRATAIGVNPVDTQVRAGSWVPDAMGRPPMILGWELVGEVAEVGSGVPGMKPGDRVFGMPRFPELARCDAEYVTAPSRHVVPVPRSLTDEQAGALPLAGLTAWQALVETAQVGEGDRVLVAAAAGGVGHLAVQIASSRGAHVIGTSRSEKHEFLRELGVGEPIDYTSAPLDQLVSDVDVVLDLVSEDDEALLASLATLREGGLLVVIAGDLSKRVLGEAARQRKRAVEMLVAPDAAALESLAGLADEGRLSVHVEASFPLDQIADAHRRQESGHVKGKLVLTP